MYELLRLEISLKVKELYLSPFWIRTVLACMSTLAVLKLGSEFHRLVWEVGPKGAIDLALHYMEVQLWFSGKPLYGEIDTAAYPPASYLLLWPLVGWGQFQFVRWFWAILCIASMIWLVRLFIRECDCRSVTERFFVALIPLSMNATGIALGNGQFAILIMPLLIYIATLIRRGRCAWNTEFVITVLFLLALVKPTFAAPFFLIVLFVCPGYRTAGAIVFSYLLLTLLASIFQEPGVVNLTANWLKHAYAINAKAAATWDYGSVHTWLTVVGLSQWNSIVSILLLCGLGIWIYHVYRVDVWLIFGVTALVARMWSYHGIYDDMLIIIPIIAVFRHIKRMTKASPPKLSAQLLLAGSIFVMLIPARLFIVWPAPWPHLYAISHIFFWLWLILYLLSAAHRENRSIKISTPLSNRSTGKR